MFSFTGIFLLLSGIASLTYQVTWIRLLGLSMGSTSASISTVLAAFFLGMALGSYLAERLIKNRIDNLKLYITLEFIIGISGLILLPILLHLDYFLAVFPFLGTSLFLKFSLAITLLLIPTICMGATFPVMASLIIRRHNEIGLRIGQLYSLNTAGAVAGAALSGFVLIPQWGLDGAIYTAFALNMLIVALAIYADTRYQLPPIDSLQEISKEKLSGKHDHFSRLALVALFTTGLVSIATQVGWTKYLAIFTGTTIYGFSAILTIFLSGIALGAWSIKSHIEKIRAPENWMAIGLILLTLSLLVTRAGLTYIPAFYRAVNHLDIPDAGIHLIKYTVVFLLLFIPTFLFGALFPLNIRLYCGNQLANVRSHIGRAYALNTIASIFGAVIAGFWIIPQYGTDALLVGSALITLTVGLFFVFNVRPAYTRVVLMAALIAVALMAVNLPQLSYEKLIASVGYYYDPDARSGKEPKFLFLKEGKAGVISAVTYGDEIARLQNNGLNESLIHTSNPNATLLAETLLGLVPFMLHEQPKSAFVVGFGGGVTTRALSLTNIGSIRVIELEPAVIEAGKALAGGNIAVLQDSRVDLDFNDARNTLLLEKNTYDLIVAQPSHPWLAGAANVFTQQFWTIAKSRLNKDGVFAQWVNLFHMDATTLRSILKAFYTVFPQGLSFANVYTGDLILIGSGKELTFDIQKMEKILAQPKINSALSYHNIKTPFDILWYFALSRDEALNAAGDTPANSDTNIFSETRLSALVKQPIGEEDPYAFLYANFNLDIIKYLPQDTSQNLFALGNYFLKQNDLFLAEKAAKQLARIDPLSARLVEYERLWLSRNYAAASALYAKHDDWPDHIHQFQSGIHIDAHEFIIASKIINLISSPALRQEANAQLLYESNNWKTLAALNSLGDGAQKWQLLALSKIDPKAAGPKLLKFTANKSADIEELRALLEYYSAINDSLAVNSYARDLISAIDKETERLYIIAIQALKNGEIPHTQLLIKMIQDLDPNAKQLAELNEKFLVVSQNKKPLHASIDKHEWQ